MPITAGARTRLEVDPAVAAVDTPLELRVVDVPPGRSVRLTLAMRDPRGMRHAASAVFVSDADGVVDVARQEPIEGAYHGRDAMGLIWAMRPDPDAARVGGNAGAVLPPVPMTFSAEIDGVVVAETTFQRSRLPAGVTRREVRQAGLVGTLFHPSDGGAHPGVLLLGGSEGGLHELDAALLAAHGFAVLAMAYFGARGVPPSLVDIPLEAFESGIGYLLAQDQVAGERVGVVGGSRGGEAALLLGATFPSVGAVVSTVGSGVMTQGIGPGRSLLEILGTPAASWSWRGERLPYLPNVVTTELTRQVASGEPVELRLAFLPALDDPRAVERATIPVERIRGGVLLVSAGDDRMWPSGPLSDVALHRLEAAQHPYPFRHVHYRDAGHPIAPPPFGPATDLLSPGPGVTFDLGGTPQHNAAARADAWRQSIDFLRDQLGTGPGS